jgi:hypothetical protein
LLIIHFKIEVSWREGKGNVLKAWDNGCYRPSDTFPLDKLVKELILRGVLFIGAGLELCITLRVLEGLIPTQYTGYIISSTS